MLRLSQRTFTDKIKSKLKPRFGDAEGFGLADINIPAQNAITIREAVSEFGYIYCGREEIPPFYYLL